MTDTISGFTHLNGSPVQARVSLIDVASNSIVGTTLSDAGTGAWAFSGLPAGTYEVLQLVDGYRGLMDGPWVLVGDGDPYWDNVVALLYGNGPDGSTSFPDEKGFVWTPAGDVKISTAQAPAFATSSVFFDGSGDYLTGPDSADFAFGLDDLTVEFWIYRAATTTQNILSVSPNAAFYMNSGSEYPFFQVGGTNVLASADSATPLPAAAWGHVAITRSSGVWRMHINGKYASNSAVRTDNLTQASPAIGRRAGSSNMMNGYLSNVRITKGVARYGVADFAPPEGAFPNFAP